MDVWIACVCVCGYTRRTGRCGYSNLYAKVTFLVRLKKPHFLVTDDRLQHRENAVFIIPDQHASFVNTCDQDDYVWRYILGDLISGDVSLATLMHAHRGYVGDVAVRRGTLGDVDACSDTLSDVGAN